MKQPELAKSLLENRRAIFGFVFALTRDFEAAEEVFQEVSLAILDEAARGTQPEDFLAWSRELARHRVADFYRARRRAPVPLSESMVDAILGAEAPPRDDRPGRPGEEAGRSRWRRGEAGARRAARAPR